MTKAPRPGGRAPGELLPLTITPDFIHTADGSVLIELGGTRVMCSAMITPGVPGWRRGSGEGWLTAEYSLLPSSTRERTPREAVRGRQDGRTVEIQRLIGRSLRAVIDLKVLGEKTIYIDCDVIEADGGTRCAAVSGGFLALHLACKKAVDAKLLKAGKKLFRGLFLQFRTQFVIRWYFWQREVINKCINVLAGAADNDWHFAAPSNIGNDFLGS